MEETYKQDGYACYIGGTWCEISTGGNVVYAGSVPEGMTAKRALQIWLLREGRV